MKGTPKKENEIEKVQIATCFSPNLSHDTFWKVFVRLAGPQKLFILEFCIFYTRIIHVNTSSKHFFVTSVLFLLYWGI